MPFDDIVLIVPTFDISFWKDFIVPSTIHSRTVQNLLHSYIIKYNRLFEKLIYLFLPHVIPAYDILF